MTRWLAHHPVLLVSALVLAAGLAATYPPLLALPVLAAAAWWGTQAYDRRHHTRTAHKRMLAAHADYEHWLLTHGHPAGVYGQFPPAEVK